ncbi:MAG: aminopeptidase N [Methylobacteriaceae bacterium]|nr:aminopeptidase N [Methylobacteriaceae bacterium]
MRTDVAPPIRLSDYRPPDYLIETVDLDISLHPGATRVRALLRIAPNPQGRAGAPLVLDGDELVCLAARLDGVALDVATIATATSLRIEAPPQRPFSLEIETRLDPSANTKLMGLYRSNGVYCTQCEAEGFRRITYFLDRPDVLSVYTTRIEGPRAETPVLLGNGNLIAAGEAALASRHFAVWHDPFPKPCYLFAVVGGDLGALKDCFVTQSGRAVELGVYVERGKEKAAGYAMDALKRAMAWDERVFGREYDLDVFNIVAVSDFNMGAMENKGLNIFNDKYVLALPETATDADYAAIEAIIAHEYFHNWTGNRITCRDWFQLCLKEGLTVFRDQEFSADERSRPVRRIADVRTLRAQQFPEDAGPLAHNVRPTEYREINNFYTATVYEKGAEVVRMLALLVGDDAFRRGMDLYFERCDGSAATVEDFLACFAEAAQRDLSQFKLWYEQAGTPTVSAASRYDAARRTFTLDLTQSLAPTPGQPTKQTPVTPIRLGLTTPAGDAPLETDDAEADEIARGVFILSTPARRIVFRNVATRPVASLLRGFSAPVRLETDQSDDDLMTLLAHDSDSFNRWQAAQTSVTRLLIASAQAIRAGEGARGDARLGGALGRVLEGALRSQSPDHASAAQIATLPSEADIAREIGADVDPDAIFLARKALRAALGAGLAPLLGEIHETLAADGRYAPDAAGAGRRALRNAALDLLVAGDAQGALERAERQFHRADNMTDQMAALAALCLAGGPQRERALESFLRTHGGEPLVIDKWLSIQATIAEPDTLDRLMALTRHHAFSWSNPNRVRALIGAFAAGNATQFHRADGAGYDFVADAVLRLDRANPQLAARLLTSFRSWRLYEETRRARARAALQRIADEKNLSRDVADIAARSLGET